MCSHSNYFFYVVVLQTLLFKEIKTTQKKNQNKLQIEEYKSESSLLLVYSKNCNSNLLEQFEIIELLGEGGFGIVFKIQQRDDGAFFALKLVQFSDDNVERQKVLRELQALTKLKHPHVVQLFEHWTENFSQELLDYLNDFSDDTPLDEYFGQPNSNNSCLLMKMELCDITLTDWLFQNPYRNRTVYLNLFHQIVNAISYLHESNWIHRDIKPSNIFLLNNVVKIGDFGLVKSTRNSDNLSTASFSSSNLDLYMAPELKLGTKYKPTDKVDIFPLGLILLEMIQCCKTAQENIRMVHAARNQNFPPNFEVEFPEEARIIRAMLQSEPSKRPSAAEILKDTLLCSVITDT